MGRPLRPPALLMRSTAIWLPTRAVLPPAAAAPESGCSVPILYGLAWPKADRQGAGTTRLAPPGDLALIPELLGFVIGHVVETLLYVRNRSAQREVPAAAASASSNTSRVRVTSASPCTSET